MEDLTALERLEQENVKNGMFKGKTGGFSYPIGFPGIDQLLGFIQDVKLPDGQIITQKRLGVPGKSITEFVGPSSSGKTAAAIQAAWNIVRRFGDDAFVIHIDAENATEPQRVIDLTGMDVETFRKRYKIISDTELMTFGNTLKLFGKIAEERRQNKDHYQYDTGFYDIFGQKIYDYLPIVVVIDSLLKITPDNIELDEIAGATDHMRVASKRTDWISKVLAFGEKFNINFIIINHLGNDISMNPMQPTSKSLTHLPTGKTIPGGEKLYYYISSIILFNPINAKATMKHADTEGYNGLPVKLSIIKSRSGPGGVLITNEFIQEYGFDARLTLLNIAKDNNLIAGRNPKCYFEGYPDVTFDTRKFLEEMDNNPAITETLFKLCKPILDKIVRDRPDPDALLGGADCRQNTLNMMDEILY